MMKFVDLDRHFAPIHKDKDAELDWSLHLGRKYGNWLNWTELLERRRVVLLAEALSGKTKELEQQALVLKNQGRPAFYVRIEDLVDHGFVKALRKEDAQLFETWIQSGMGDAWFFLDSVDEARLNSKSFPSALRAFNNELGNDGLNRSFIFVSCRVSDWKGKSDRHAIEVALPFVPRTENFAAQDIDEIFLAPIFDKKTTKNCMGKQQEKSNPADLLVVQLVPLTDEQKKKMAKAAGIDAQVFLQSINKSGLSTMAERPGDLIDLINYWDDHFCFGSLLEMTAAGVRRKLSEEDQCRDGLLSVELAMEGAQRLAAALVLAKTFMLKSPGQEADLALSKGAIDSFEILGEWEPKAVNALLRTGLFAPSTYGRIKFHHRTTQEFLAACWLHTLLKQNCPISEIKRLLFAEPYGLKTAVPSLLAVSAWLSQWEPTICKELIEREPVALIMHGDPKSLSLKIRESLLDSYALLDAAGRIDYEYIDHRAAWMFSNPELANAIKSAWQVNSKQGFRLNLLHFIEEGRVGACVHLAREVACGQSQDDMRIAAARALVACDDQTGLKKLARQLIAEPDRLSARLAPSLAELLYPKYMKTTDLLMLIAGSEQARKFSSDGFATYLAALHDQAASRSDKKRLVAGIVDLVLGSNRLDAANEIDTLYTELCKGVASLVNAELALCGAGEVADGTLRLLMAVERILNFYHDDEALPLLRERVRKDKRLNRQLMWADATAWRSRPATEHQIVHFCQIGPFFGRRLWDVDASDLEWLIDDARKMDSEEDRRIAFSAVWQVLQGDEVSPWYAHLESLASGDAALSKDLTEFVKPREPDVHAQIQLETELEEKQEIERAKRSWLDLHEELSKNPAVLTQASALSSWKGGLHRHYYLMEWIKMRAAKERKDDALSFALLNDVFSTEVVEHYASGIRQVWRHIKPARPTLEGNIRSSHRMNVLALDALRLDSQSSDWAMELSDLDAKTAVRHAIFVGTIKLTWLAKLVQARPTIALPEIAAAVQYEFRSNNQFCDILSSAAHYDVPAQDVVATQVFWLLKCNDPADIETLKNCTRIVSRNMNVLARKDVIALAQKRLIVHLNSENKERTFAYLRVLAAVDSDGLAQLILTQLIRQSVESKFEFESRVQHWLGELFDRHTSNGVGLVALQSMQLEALAQLLKLAYSHIRPHKDRTSNTNSTVTRRDRAEGARNSLLTALMDRRETAAYDVLIQMANSVEYERHAMSFLQLAHRKAQADAEIESWTAAEVTAFGKLYAVPAKTGGQLLNITMAVLSDIRGSFDNADATSRSLLARANDEEEVQQWLAERLQERSKDRYHTHREPQVANKKKPDIILSSTSCSAQVAIEIKNANKRWTVKQLESAITKQLAGLYLLPEERRHGILLISLHQPKTWRVDGKVWDFGQLISHLTSLAKQVTSNRQGAVEVKIVAINASPP